jgi:hypothetical protein
MIIHVSIKVQTPSQVLRMLGVCADPRQVAEDDCPARDLPALARQIVRHRSTVAGLAPELLRLWDEERAV